MIRVGVKGLTNGEFAALGYLLYPHKIEFRGQLDSSDLIISADSSVDSSKPLIRLTRSPAHPGPSGYLDPSGCINGIVDLPSDLLRICSQRFDVVMNPRVAFIYRLATALPFRYKIIPPSISNCFLRMRHLESDLSHHLANETARRILKEAFSLLGFSLERKSPPSVLITHDVETQKGLRRAFLLKKVEDDLGMHSIWFLQSGEYSIPKAIARDLAQGSTIGSHDVRHDGKLIRISRYRQLVQRLMESKVKLEHIFERDVCSFRSPLLQSGRRIMSALKEAGYCFDFSLPCWEPVYPLTMSGFGVQCVQRFEVDGLVEIPLTLFQDHQVLSVLGMNTSQAVKLWIEQAALVRSLDGDIVVLIHPEYAFSRDLHQYKKLLVSLTEYK